ncbi:MAG TPA: PadR family transcriptional regulator [Caldisericia bacterium]|nr:PadR family transcriptional regulator [Caldisericia bacterium]HOU08892.1 PadR family transcriptional regulator [Caldisericia bacterium]HPL88797.1 PadR family transcriptional regulator [Caldisericia bacterium]HQG60187.1 PadR family transcriptional regulator [Caldisericia bacterium]HQH49522.1 PadR family transcriptional regulator [Caldisericia bacterium]
MESDICFEEKFTKEFFLGFIKLHVLHHSTKEPVYGLWFIEELSRHGYKMSPGTLYPILHQLEKNGYLESFREKVAGRLRVYYEATENGKKALEEARSKIKHLIKEVLYDEE